jgi:hypothetical protein
MNTSVLPPLQHDVVLAAVKATPSGWPPASLDPTCGRRPGAASGTKEIHQFQVSTVSGDCHTFSAAASHSRLF